MAQINLQLDINSLEITARSTDKQDTILMLQLTAQNQMKPILVNTNSFFTQYYFVLAEISRYLGLCGFVHATAVSANRQR